MSVTGSGKSGSGGEVPEEAAVLPSGRSEQSGGRQQSEQEDVHVVVPNEEFIRLLMDMGITRGLAEKAVRATANHSADMAAAWVFEHNEDEEDDPSSTRDVTVCKMVFVVNAQLGMGVGKVAAQVAHAALGLHRILQHSEETAQMQLFQWEEDGERKVVVRGVDTEHLNTLEVEAVRAGVSTYTVTDAGHTQVPTGSLTVLGLFGPQQLVDQISGDLRLL